MSHETSEKGGTTSCAYSCAVCGEAEQDFPTADEREIDRLRGRIQRAKDFAFKNIQRDQNYHALLDILEGREP